MLEMVIICSVLFGSLVGIVKFVEKVLSEEEKEFDKWNEHKNK